MKRQLGTALFVCICLLAWSAGGQDEPAETPENPPAETQNEQTSADDEQDAPASEEVFTPSENISEDISVPLPVDI